jgi:AcrR family transcriptional regulator
MPRHKNVEREAVLSATRQALLDAAADEFAREGYVGANINRIAKSAGFAKGTIYNYFSSKRALMLALIDEIADAHIHFVEEQVQQEDGTDRRLVRFFEAGFDFVTDHYARMQVLIDMLYGADVEFKGHMYSIYQPMFRLVREDIVAFGIEQGVFRQVDPVAMSGLLMTIYLGTSSQLDEQGKIWLDAGQVSDFALNALRKHP